MADINTQYLIKVSSEGAEKAAGDWQRLTTTVDRAGNKIKEFIQSYDAANRKLSEGLFGAGGIAGGNIQKSISTVYDEVGKGYNRQIVDYQRSLEKLRADLALQGKAEAYTYQQTSGLTTPQGVQETIRTYQQFGDQLRLVSERVTLNGTEIRNSSIQYGEFNGRLVETGRTVNDLTRNLDRQSSTLDHLRRRFQFIAEWMLFQEVLNLATQAMDSWITEQRLMSSELADFDIITRGATSSVKAYSEAVNSISRRTGIAPGEIAQGVLAQMRVPYAPQDAALRGAEVQRVTGMDNVAAQRELIGLTIQTGLSGEQVLDRFAGAMRRSTLGAEELFGMLETAGPLAQQFNTSFERILGMIAGTSTVTGEAGNSIELLMRQLNRLYTDPQSKAMAEHITGVPVVSMVNGVEVRRDLYDVLGEIAAAGPQAIQDFAETFPNVLGQKNQQLLIGMLKGWNNVREAVESTENSVGLWGDSVERHMNTVTSGIDEVRSAWQRLLRVYDQSDSIINFLQTYADLLDRIADAKDLISKGGLLLDIKSSTSLNPVNAAKRVISSAVNALPENKYINAYKDVLSNPFDPLLNLLVDSGIVHWPERQRQNMLKNAPDYSSYASTGMDRWEKEIARVMASPEYQQEQLRQTAQRSGLSGFYVSPTMFGGPLPSERVTVPGGLDVDSVRRAYRDILNKEIAALGKQPGYAGYSQYELETMVSPADAQVALALVTEFGEVLQVTTGDVDRFNLAVKQAAEEAERRGIDPETGQRIYGKPLIVTDEQQANFEKTWGTKLNAKVMQTVIDANVDEQAKSFVGALEMSAEAANAMARGQQAWIPILDESKRALFMVYSSADNASAALADLTGVTGQLSLSILSLPMVGGVRVGIGDYAGKLREAVDWAMQSDVLKGVPQGELETRRFFDPTTRKYEDVTATPEALSIAQAVISSGFDNQNELLTTANDYAREQRDFLRSIASGMSSLASSILQPTSVTEADMWATKAGTYEDKWDEPARRVRDVMERRKAMNPDLGPHVGEVAGYGIDLSSIESTMATGQSWLDKFYGGQLDPAFYEEKSKEGFLRAARKKIDEDAARERLQQQAVGWLTEAGFGEEIARQVAREQSGDVSILEKILLGGKTSAEISKDFQATTQPIGEGVIKGLNKSIKDSDLIRIIEDGFGLKGDTGQGRLSDLGYSIGVWMVKGVRKSFNEHLLDAITSAVLATIEAELRD